MIVMAVSTLGPFDSGLLPGIQAALEACFPVEVTAGCALALPMEAYDAGRDQWNSPVLLKYVLAATPAGARLHLALTMEDLYIPMLTFVYGQAQLGGRAAIVSLARLRQEYYRLPANAALLQARARKEAVHETGHLFGLVHCEAETCAMRLSTTVRQIDMKSDLLCASCAEQAWGNAV
jgi:archaemetzincin